MATWFLAKWGLRTCSDLSLKRSLVWSIGYVRDSLLLHARADKTRNFLSYLAEWRSLLDTSCGGHPHRAASTKQTR